MANSFFECFKQEALGDTAGPGHGAIDFETPAAGGIQFALMDTADYTVNLATHQDQVDLTDSGIVATSAGVACTVTNSGQVATLDAADWTWSSVTGDQSEGIAGFHDSGTDSSSMLFLWLDTFSSGMPVTPNGGDINVTVHGSGLFTW
tara:strand:+ start:717 stop:1160 length:444 start_codon:yes stop_codon:yes gene_type:complete